MQGLSQEFTGSHPPQGLAAATGDVTSTVLSRPLQHNGRAAPQGISITMTTTTRDDVSSEEANLTGPPPYTRELTEPFENGYHFPPKYTWQESTVQGLKAFWKFFTTPMGFFITIYALNVVAWGGMIFLLLCNAAPAMCYPTCDDIDSPRRKWIEYTAQILTGLFCVTAFGLAPWRFRDWYYLLHYRVFKDQDALRRLAAIHNSWFRLRGTQELPVHIGPGNLTSGVPQNCIPIPEKEMPKPPLTGTRAPDTKMWKLDFVIWSMVGNTFAQCGLCGIMWGMNRFDRPSWATGFLVAIACLIAMAGGLLIFLEGKTVKSIEGVPLTEQDRERLERDKELGIAHYNNIKGKMPKVKEKKKWKKADVEAH